jgi:hypothetical protein
MKRHVLICSALLASTALLAPALRADVTTRRKTQFKLEGILGSLVNRFGGDAAKNGLESTIAVKGNRMSTISNVSGHIVDLDEQKVYDLDVKKKEYTVKTFDQLRAEWENAQAQAKTQAEKAQPEEKRQQPKEPEKQYVFEANVQQTGQHKQLAGYDTQEVILTITAHEKGQTLEEGGGFVMTSDLWLGPKIPALDEITQFNLKFDKAVYGEAFGADVQQMASMYAMYPAFAPMSRELQAQHGKLQGTPLLSTTRFDGVKSAEEMKADESQQPAGGGGGLGGLLGRRLRGGRNKPEQRSTVMTLTSETLSVQPSATDADVAIPAGYTLKGQ